MRTVVYLIWAIACVLVWGRVLVYEFVEYRNLPDHERRSSTPETRRVGIKAAARRALIADFALFLVAVACFLAIISLVIADQIPGARGFFLALALGAFLGAGFFRWPRGVVRTR